MTALNTDLRSRLENAVKEARTAAESGARQALGVLAVGLREPHAPMTSSDQSLRRRLRAHGRQLGDVRERRGTQTIHRLVREVAYEHWHRMLFARFLAENHLLIEPDSGVAITLEECVELARERGEDPWALAASFAQGMLPQIFRTGDPALEVTLPPETRQALQRLLGNLPRAVFLEDDSLGWTYQFWQSAEKDAVNARVKSGEKITGETLPAVTQLFTEPYMVRFLLHNTLGAWHAGKVLLEAVRETATSEQDLREAVRLSFQGGYDFEYLRFVREPTETDENGEPTGPWRPATGTFSGWPKTAKELKVLDPCCGSGHFLVEAFGLLVRLRMQEERLDLRATVRAVIEQNLFGLELDHRCTQIAAFNLALAAWRLVGSPIDLPPMRIACSGIGPQASKDEWLELAEEAAAAEGVPGKRDLFGTEDTLLSAGIRDGLEDLYDLFEKAPELGSLIDPTAMIEDGSQFDAFREDFGSLEPLLEGILRRGGAGEEEVEMAVAAKGMTEAARILVGSREGYSLVVTNVPFLGRGAHTDAFKGWADTSHHDARSELATIFLSRMLRWVGSGERTGTVAVVMPQNWLFQRTYRKLRQRLLRNRIWDMVVRLGPKGFRTPMWDFNIMLTILSSGRPDQGMAGRGSGPLIAGIDAMAARSPEGKEVLLRGRPPLRCGSAEDRLKITEGSLHQAGGNERHPPPHDPSARDGVVQLIPQLEQLKNPGSRVLFTEIGRPTLLDAVAYSQQGITTGDLRRFGVFFWEIDRTDSETVRFWQSTVSRSASFSGRELMVKWVSGEEALEDWPGATLRGSDSWGKDGVVVSLMGDLPVTISTGEISDDNTTRIIPKDPNHLGAIWSFCSSAQYRQRVREVDQALKVMPNTALQVPFEVAQWREVSKEQYPNGLPEPHSDDPAQWIFHGHHAHSDAGTELQVAVARLLGYRWPAELDSDIRLSEEARTLIEQTALLDDEGFADSDGLVCLSLLRGEASAANRLRALLAFAYGADWSPAKERELIAAAAESEHGTGRRASSLEEWLLTSFFEEHCRLFHHRPFVWHVWDGLKDGFNALVSYHRLAGSDGIGRRTLDSVTFAYLGEWIERQRAAQLIGQEGADARLVAALHLQDELKRILEGNPPYDLFVRWKPLHQQPLGWEPDINDGVRLNIRPFLLAEDVGRKGAGILRFKPNVKWKKDRGKEPESLRPRDAFPWFWGCDPENEHRHRIDFGAGTSGSSPASEDFDGARWNALHYTRAAKEAARRRNREEGST